MVKYNKAPLPFLGQKRNFLKVIREIDFSNKIVVDLFGGSGLLAHTVKQNNPSAIVIWNDFDDYQSRLNSIKRTEKLRSKLFEITSGLPKKGKIEAPIKQQLINIIVDSGSKDFLTISSWLLFSGNYAHSLEKLIAQAWYARVVQTPLSCDSYLVGVERVQADFRVLINQCGGSDNVIYLADPPYIMTNQAGYAGAKADKHFRLKYSIDCIRLLHDKRVLMFSSPKSETDDLLEVWPPSHLIRYDYKASVGFGKLLGEYLYCINVPNIAQNCEKLR